MSFIECKNISFVVKNNESIQYILNDINLSIEKGDFVIILGKSGSGKTTLLNTMVGLIKPTSGYSIIDGYNITTMKEIEKTYWRRYYIGYVFQNYGLFEILNVFDNIYLSLDLNSQFSFKAKKVIKDYVKQPKPTFAEVDEIMKRLKIDHLANKFPHELSGGQQQRVSLARILIKKPKVVFADEPTGALDHETSLEVMDMLVTLNNSGSTIVMITHNENLVKYANKVIKMSDGKIVYSTNVDNSLIKQENKQRIERLTSKSKCDNAWDYVFDRYSQNIALNHFVYKKGGVFSEKK